MTVEDMSLTELGIADSDQNRLIIGAGLEWIKQNTTLDIDELECLPFTARLFLIKFYDLQSISAGVTSESIEGLSQSFESTDKTALLWQYAQQLLGAWIKSAVKFVAAKDRW